MTPKSSDTKVTQLMTPHPVLISPDATLKEAAEKMKHADCGAIPVGTESKLKGIITDRDIVIRALAQGKDPSKEKVGDYMTGQVFACNENDTLEDAAFKMHKHKVSRLIVKDREGKAIGILSFGRLFKNEISAKEIADVVEHACCAPMFY